jgi:hypothetical protein
MYYSGFKDDPNSIKRSTVSVFNTLRINVKFINRVIYRMDTVLYESPLPFHTKQT